MKNLLYLYNFMAVLTNKNGPNNTNNSYSTSYNTSYNTNFNNINNSNRNINITLLEIVDLNSHSSIKNLEALCSHIRNNLLKKAAIDSNSDRSIFKALTKKQNTNK